MNIERMYNRILIEELKARYFRLMDTKAWDEYRTIFADDVVVYIDPGRTPTDVEPIATSADDFVGHVRGRIGSAVTVHHGHMPEIMFQDDDHATGIWSMYDWVDDPEHALAWVGFGHYHDKFRRRPDGSWCIEELRLCRIRVDRTEPTSSETIERVSPLPEES